MKTNTARYIQWLRWLILFVIGLCVLWSISNISYYAYEFHQTPAVWLLGIVVGLSVAISVAAFVIARNDRQRAPAIVGLVLFGIASGALQMMYYRQLQADWVTAIAFGWIGPIAEGVLSWLHASFELAESKPREVKTKVVEFKPEPEPASFVTAPAPELLPYDWATLLGWTPARRQEYLNTLKAGGYSDAKLARLFGVADTTIARQRNGGRRGQVVLTPGVNGNGHV